MKRVVTVMMCSLALAGCGVFGGKSDKKPKTPVLGERIPILVAESDVKVDTIIADVPVLLPPPVQNDSWEQPGGNASKSMGNLALGASIGKIWSVSIAGSSKKARLAASPVVASNKVFVVDTKAVLHAFDVNSGRVQWRQSLADKSESDKIQFGGGVSFSDGAVYATTGAGEVFRLDAQTGNIVWKVRPAGPLRGAPTVELGNVYAMTYDNQIYALSATDGHIIWSEAGTMEVSGVFGVAAPAAGQGTVVAGFSSGELTAYRYENGRAVWQDALARTGSTTSVAALSDIDASPVIDQGKVYAIGAGGRMVAMELVTGQRLWEQNVGGIAMPWVVGDWIYVITDEARLMCLSRTTGRARWITDLPRWKNEKKRKNLITWKGPIVAGGRLLLVNSEGDLLNVSAENGAVGTRLKGGEGIYLQPVVAQNSLFTLSDDGKLTAWR